MPILRSVDIAVQLGHARSIRRASSSAVGLLDIQAAISDSNQATLFTDTLRRLGKRPARCRAARKVARHIVGGDQIGTVGLRRRERMPSEEARAVRWDGDGAAGEGLYRIAAPS